MSTIKWHWFSIVIAMAALVVAAAGLGHIISDQVSGLEWFRTMGYVYILGAPALLFFAAKEFRKEKKERTKAKNLHDQNLNAGYDQGVNQLHLCD